MKSIQTNDAKHLPSLALSSAIFPEYLTSMIEEQKSQKITESPDEGN